MPELNPPSLATHETDQRPLTKRTPLPKLQIFIVCLIQFSEPVTATVIYPFINQLVRETGVTMGDPRKTGYFAGLIESAFFLTEALTVLQWGWASDYLGRRPVLLLGPLGLAFTMVSFGLSSRFRALLISRCLQGVFNGNIGVSKTVMAEITDSSNIADAYALIPVVWMCGMTFSPVLGGVLSRPATQWPNIFGNIPFFDNHPYFLPCGVAAFIALCSAMIAFIGLRETLPLAIARQAAKRKQRAIAHSTKSDSNSTALLVDQYATNYGSTNMDPLCERDLTHSTVPERPPAFHTLLVPQVLIPMSSLAFLSFTEMSCHVLMPLVYSTSIPLGGLGLDPYHIGIIMGTVGILNAFVQIVFFGRIIRKFGPRTTFIVGQMSHVVILGLYPLLTFFARRAGRVDSKVWAVLIIQLVCNTSIVVAYGALQIFVVNSAPSRASLGATNGMAQAAASLMRSIAPSFASSLFSFSLQKKLAGGNMVYFFLLGISAIAIRISFFLPKHPRSENR